MSKAMINTKKLEAKSLRFSVFGYLFMAALGIGFSFLTRSEAIMLDGVYSLLSFIMAIVAGKVAKLVEIPLSENFHFGYAHFEPWINAIRGLMILVLCGMAFFSAINALLHEGRPLSAGFAVIYGFIAASGCFAMSYFQKKNAKKTDSPLLVVDSRNWLVDGVISTGATLTFVIALVFENIGFNEYVPYVDPTLVVLMTFALISVPLKTVKDNFWEIMGVAPNAKIQKEISTGLNEILEDLPVNKVQLRMMKIGRFFYLMAHIVFKEDYEPGPLSYLDDLRCQIYQALAKAHPRLTIDVIFTCREEWALGKGEKSCRQ